MAITTYNSDSYEVLDLPNGYRGINNEYFKRFLTFHGIPIMAPRAVNDFAIREARYLMGMMLEKCDHRIAPLRDSNLFIAIVPQYPGGVFDPSLDNANYIVVDEINILQDDRSILIHEVAHSLHYTLAPYEKNKLQTFFDASRDYYNTDAYATTNVYEYFAEAVSAYFNAGTPSETINNRDQLRAFDSSLYNYVDAIFEGNDFQWTPVTERLNTGHLYGYNP